MEARAAVNLMASLAHADRVIEVNDVKKKRTNAQTSRVMGTLLVSIRYLYLTINNTNLFSIYFIGVY